ncbi:MAG: TolC family protein [Bacteroidales bacterium]|nr:TolC family protein [Bacteroidales bacterium]
MKFSLEQSRQYALENSPVLKNSARDVDIAKKKIWETTAIGLPQAELSGTYSYSPELAGLSDLFAPDTTQAGGEGGTPPIFGNINANDLKTNFFMNVQVSQLIFNGQYLVGLKASKVYSDLSKLADSKSKIGVSESITNTYFTALIARQARMILDSTLKVVEKTLFQTTELYKNGFVESTDVDQIKILHTNIKTSLSVSIRQEKLMERLLKFQMGIPVDQSIELSDEIEPLVNGMILQAESLDSFDLNNNVDYQLLTTQEKLAKLNMQQQKSQFLPVIAGFYQRYESLDDNFFNDQSTNTFGLSLSLPLFNSGQRLSQVGQRQLEYMKAQTNTQMTGESLLIQYETSFSEFLSAKDIYTMQKENKDLSLKIYRKSLIRFTEGVGSSMDLNQAQTQYFDAESSYFQAVMSFVSAKSKLESLLAQ